MSQIVTEIYEAFRAANVGDDLAKAAGPGPSFAVSIQWW